jgi:hypothetical protein
MKLPRLRRLVSPFTFHTRRPHGEQGIAVIVVLVLIVIVLIFLMGNVRTFHSLSGELKLLEKQQTKRLQAKAGAGTNAPPSVERVVSP